MRAPGQDLSGREMVLTSLAGDTIYLDENGQNAEFMERLDAC
jgi:hypothetical protein